MASVSAISSPNIPSFCRKPISKNLILRPFVVDFPWCRARTSGIKTNPDGAGPTSNGGADLLRWPASSDPGGDDDPADEAGEKKGGDGDTWVDWDDQILQDTVPLVGFVRTVLHSGKYASGDRLSLQDEKTILEKLLAYHPACEKKIGCGVDYITAGLIVRRTYLFYKHAYFHNKMSYFKKLSRQRLDTILIFRAQDAYS